MWIGECVKCFSSTEYYAKGLHAVELLYSIVTSCRVMTEVALDAARKIRTIIIIKPGIST